ncbi:hypothetical protein FF36_01866 [Frankia torreyi]|uniref:Uncharacterized protein n=1 Tax=Frankia torreyi TaxID=1856 RepID=A0A0D8BHR1_9ACTN|nr:MULTISPECIES: hypothetical protein [Frankia]KJE23681.1 hypothetical protein FF36_01866 [Frankia torreyi]KQC39013.1 hypothetical protein UK82_07415 [Frankia sp. ACN1ag]
MIPAHGYTAFFRPSSEGGDKNIVGGLPASTRDGEKLVCQVPVVAWGNNGEALVADMADGCLRSVRGAEGFIRLTRAASETVGHGESRSPA